MLSENGEDPFTITLNQERPMEQKYLDAADAALQDGIGALTVFVLVFMMGYAWGRVK